MKSKVIYLFLALALIAFTLPVSAQKSGNFLNLNLPEQAGVYSVPGHPSLKLRVFVYQAKPDQPGKPGPTAPQEVCGISDPDSYAVVDPAGWKLPTQWEYNLNLASTPGTIGSTNLATIASNAFNAWEKQVGNKVTITRGANTLVTKASFDGENIITWGRTSGSALAVSYIWYTGGIASEVDTIFNNKFSWYWDSKPSCAWQGVYDAQDILTHELGHTFGLDDMYTSSYVDNTMYGYGSKGEIKKDTLTSGDITAVKNLY
jgi:hypothetical protein